MIRFESGDVRISVLDAGELWLDGGAMFGVVPKPLWEKERRPDDRNRIRLAMNLLLIEDGRRTMLVDTGAGDKWDEKSRRIYRLDPRTPDLFLEGTGVTPDRIDTVIASHLHFDHAGGNTRRSEDGSIVPWFANATYVVQQKELEVARMNNERTRASYIPENFEPLAAEPDRLKIVDGPTSLSNRVRLEPAPGHTPGMQAVCIDTGEETVCFLADLVPTTSHVRAPYIMGYDLEPLVTLASKKALLGRALAEQWCLIFEHDAETPVAKLEQVNDRMRATPYRPEG